MVFTKISRKTIFQSETKIGGVLQSSVQLFTSEKIEKMPIFLAAIKHLSKVNFQRLKLFKGMFYLIPFSGNPTILWSYIYYHTTETQL